MQNPLLNNTSIYDELKILTPNNRIDFRKNAKLWLNFSNIYLTTYFMLYYKHIIDYNKTINENLELKKQYNIRHNLSHTEYITLKKQFNIQRQKFREIDIRINWFIHNSKQIITPIPYTSEIKYANGRIVPYNTIDYLILSTAINPP
jgi:hypothetical protein